MSLFGWLVELRAVVLTQAPMYFPEPAATEGYMFMEKGNTTQTSKDCIATFM
jgi:hypothetical protein